MEHEHQRAIQRKLFEDELKVLEQQQAAELLSLLVDPTGLASPNGLHNLSPLSQTWTFYNTYPHNSIGKLSKWPHFGVLNPVYEPKLPIATVSASVTPSIVQHHTWSLSHCSSPPGMANTLLNPCNIATCRGTMAT